MKTKHKIFVCLFVRWYWRRWRSVARGIQSTRLVGFWSFSGVCNWNEQNAWYKPETGDRAGIATDVLWALSTANKKGWFKKDEGREVSWISGGFEQGKTQQNDDGRSESDEQAYYGKSITKKVHLVKMWNIYNNELPKCRVNELRSSTN